MPQECETCLVNRAQILRPKNHARLCAACFIDLFEAEVAETITSSALFQPGERIAMGASGGKDSCVLASVMKTLNDRHAWELELVLLSIDEGIQGYRDHSLDAVRRNSEELGLPLRIVSYSELYGWSMDQVVAQIGKKGNCTYCGVFRRQALDRGAAMLGVGHVVTGHNADDVAETILMNLLRGDLPRLSRATSIITSIPSAIEPETTESSLASANVKRSKPLMYAYEKEIVMYAHYKKLDYFSTECIYSPEAFRGSARTLIKNLERIKPESILDIVQSGIDMAKLAPGHEEQKVCKSRHVTKLAEQETIGGCGTISQGSDSMTVREKQLRQVELADSQALETYRTDASKELPNLTANTVSIRLKTSKGKTKPAGSTKQKLGQCKRCGYMSSQTVCKACVLLEDLNKARPINTIEIGVGRD